MHEGFRWLIGWFVVLGLVWLALGGPDQDTGGLFIRTGTNGTLSESKNLDRNNDGVVDEREAIAGEIERVEKELTLVEKELQKLEEEKRSSPFKDFVSLERATAATADPEREYLRIRISRSAKEPISFAGWHLESKMTGRRVLIPPVTKLPISGQAGTQETLRAPQGAVLIINTGRSPIGHSFQINSCTGYFEQFQNFNPSLPRQCPHPADEPAVDRGPHGFGDACLDYLESLPRCTAHIGSPPLGMPTQCQEYIGSSINYNACVGFHKTDSDFYKNEWRLYLRREEELWKAKREIIVLLDQNEKIVATITY